MKLYITAIALVAIVQAAKCKTKDFHIDLSTGGNVLQPLTRKCSDNGYKSDAICYGSPVMTQCSQTLTYPNGWETEQNCWSNRANGIGYFRAGNGDGPTGACCDSNKDCQDTCNGVICGESW